MAKFNYWWRAVDVETGRSLTPGKIHGSKDAALESILHAGFSLCITDSTYSKNHNFTKGIAGDWHKYALKRVRQVA